MDTQRTEEDIQTDIASAEQEHSEVAEILNAAREKWEKFKDELKSHRVAKFDQEVVAEATRVGLNPHNFDTQELLEEAITKATAEREIVEPTVSAVEDAVEGA